MSYLPTGIRVLVIHEVFTNPFVDRTQSHFIFVCLHCHTNESCIRIGRFHTSVCLVVYAFIFISLRWLLGCGWAAIRVIPSLFMAMKCWLNFIWIWVLKAIDRRGDNVFVQFITTVGQSRWRTVRWADRAGRRCGWCRSSESCHTHIQILEPTKTREAVVHIGWCARVGALVGGHHHHWGCPTPPVVCEMKITGRDWHPNQTL